MAGDIVGTPHSERAMSATNRYLLVCAMGIAGTLLPGCGRPSSSTSPQASPASSTSLEVINRSSADMDVYVVRAGQRIPVGFAPGNETTRFVLSPGQVAGVGTVQFQAVPRSGLARPIGSEPTPLRAGDTITLNIPPP